MDKEKLDNALLLSFRLFLHDKVEAEKTIIAKINRHLAGDELITDNIVDGVRVQCQQHNINFKDVVQHMKGVKYDQQGDMEKG